jgi:quinohemoprotein amine dehydrogenase
MSHLRRRFVLMFCLAIVSASTLAQQTQPAPGAPGQTVAVEQQVEEGIPILSPVVQETCGPCHRTDEKNRISRISYRRTTPEGWQETIKRMVTLNNAKIQPEQAREVLKVLSNAMGLAPEEVRPAAFEVERRLVEFKYADSKQTGPEPQADAKKDAEQVCSKCHSMGRVMLERRTKEDWELLAAMHEGFYPLTSFQAFRRMEPLRTEPGPDGRPPDNRHPVEKALAHLSSAFPLRTPEWSAWSANMRPPRLAGRWAVSGYQTGKGPFYGQMVVTAIPVAVTTDAAATTTNGAAATHDADEFATETRYLYPRTGETVVRHGKGIVYTGFQWRGRSSEGGSDSNDLREVMFVERDMDHLWGRWFRGAYDEIGLDVKLQRIANNPVVLGAWPLALQLVHPGSTPVVRQVRIYGSNFPASLSSGDIDFGRGIRVVRVTSSTPDLVTAEIELGADASIGARDVFVAGASKDAAVIVFDKIDGLKVLPQAGMARVGGINFPKQYQQFEAVAFNNGTDGKPQTKDDLELGPVDVTWTIEEFTATFGDDDKKFVGTIDGNGLFTPNVDGPNAARRGRGNNVGDVWIVATLKPNATTGDKTVRARAHLLVTVPLYMRWQPEVMSDEAASRGRL